jgi:hypothetical protein
MDKRLEQALDFSNFRNILLTRQKNLKVLMNNKLTLVYGGGVFKVDKELISFIDFLIKNKTNSFVFIDSNDIPILIEDLKDFGEKVFSKYESALFQYHKTYQKLAEARDIRKVIDWDAED